MKRGCLGILFAAVLSIDQWTKYLAEKLLSVHSPTFVGSLFGVDFFWDLSWNKGAAWGMFHEYPLLLLFLRILFIGVLWFVCFRNGVPKFVQICLMGIIAGAASNVVDTIRYGHVIDMIRVVLWGYEYPVFNVADSTICLGAIFILVHNLFFEKKHKSL